jgi:hypothetical protein
MSHDPQHRLVRVATPCTREQVQEIRMRAGDSVAVGHRNQQHPAFVWCATEDGHHGWVPEDFLEMTGQRSALARRDYDSTHLTVSEDEELDVLEQVGDYLLCRTATGVQGWVRASCVHELEEE